MKQLVEKLYGQDSNMVMDGIARLTEKYAGGAGKPRSWLSQRDAVLITYGDSIKTEGEPPLQTLEAFLREYASGALTAVHILPCFPYSSDDGFSVIDYRKIAPELGTWDDVERIARGFDLMLDAVINHASVKSEWFQGFLRRSGEYQDYFITADPDLDYSAVERPRALPLLHEFETPDGKLSVWMTFSDDQADLNYRSPRLFLEVLDILGFYAQKGARLIRLDAIGFMYKKQGTSCIHLPETHQLIKLMRAFLDRAFPGTILVTETNVPHQDNISYFGNADEAHMVYQFPLPPLTLHSFCAQNATKLLDWLEGLEPAGAGRTFFNFLASHDGIGLNPTEGILTPQERDLLVAVTQERGGFVSYKSNGDGTESPYELNINYGDALSAPAEGEAMRVKRMLAAHAILFSLAGVPGLYIHSLLGSRGDRQAAIASGINRRVNREKLEYATLCRALAGTRGEVFHGLLAMLRLRGEYTAFAPDAAQKILRLDERVFSLWRMNAETGEKILALVNVSASAVRVATGIHGIDLISGLPVADAVSLSPAGYLWILCGEE
jgi:sucrose phosphorylase